MIARRHMYQYGTTREMLAAVAVKNHANGAKNPQAHMRKTITLEQAMNGGNWFDREQEVHRHAVARCLARIATPRSIAVLDAGAGSRRAPVRQACEAALQTRKAA